MKPSNPVSTHSVNRGREYLEIDYRQLIIRGHLLMLGQFQIFKRDSLGRRCPAYGRGANTFLQFPDK